MKVIGIIAANRQQYDYIVNSLKHCDKLGGYDFKPLIRFESEVMANKFDGYIQYGEYYRNDDAVTIMHYLETRRIPIMNELLEKIN